MNSVVQAIRDQYPEYDSLSDDELTVRTGLRYPQYRQQPDFATDYNRLLSTAISRPSSIPGITQPPQAELLPPPMGPGASPGGDVEQSKADVDAISHGTLNRPERDLTDPSDLYDALRETPVGRAVAERAQPLTALATVPGRIASTAGKAGQALLGDLAAGPTPAPAIEGEPETFGGNVKAFLRHDDKLPVQRALELSKEADREQNVTGWQTIAADISLGLADLAPKVAMLEAAPSGGLAGAASAAGIFGANEKGQVDPKSAAFAALFPYATKMAGEVTDQAIAKAVERGFEFAGTPGAQRALHVAANQAAMNALMTVQGAPELMQLLEDDPAEFKREMAKMIGSNLAFGIPEALKARERISQKKAAAPEEPNAPNANPGSPSPAPADLADLQSTMTGNQIPGKKNKLQRAMDELVTKGPIIDETDTGTRAGDLREAEKPTTSFAVNEEAADGGAATNPGSERPAVEPGDEADVPERIAGPALPRDRTGQLLVEQPEASSGAASSLERSEPETSGPVETVAPKEKAVKGLVAGSQLEMWADQVLKGGGAHAGPDVLAAYLVKGAALIERGVTDFAAWSAEMVRQFGDAIRPHLKSIFDEAARPGAVERAARTSSESKGEAAARDMWNSASEGGHERLLGTGDGQGKDWHSLTPEQRETVMVNMGVKEKTATSPQPSPPAEREPRVPTTPEEEASRSQDFRLVQKELDEASGAMQAAIAKMDPRKAGGLTRTEVLQEKAMATARFRILERELNEHPGYVTDLLTRQEKLSNELKEGTDLTGANGGNGGPAGTDRLELRRELEDVQQRLERTPAALRNKIYHDLQEKGVIPKPPPGPVLGRSQDALNDDVSEMVVDSPKRTLRERLDLSRRLAERWTGAKKGIEKAQLRLGAAWRTGVESFLHPFKSSGFRDIIKQWILQDTYTGVQAQRWVKEINSKVENPLRQMAMTVWIEAGGDVGLLRAQSAAVPEKYKPVYDTALKLTPSEKELALRIKRDFDDKLEDGKRAGFVEKGRENYIPQRWAKPPPQDPAIEAARKGKPGNPQGKLDPRNPYFSLPRARDSYFDGIMEGGEPQSLKISELVADYQLAFQKALSSKGVIKSLSREMAADGKPITAISGRVDYVSGENGGPDAIFGDGDAGNPVSADGRSYVTVDHFALKGWEKKGVTKDGTPIVLKGDMKVHPDHADFLKNELSQSPLREGKLGMVFNPIFKGAGFLKQSKFAFASFHMATVMKQMASYCVNPFNGDFQIDLRDPKQSRAVYSGLELGMSGPQSAFEEGLASHGGIFRVVPGLGEVMGRFSDFLFKEYIPKVAMRTWMVVNERNTERYAGKLSQEHIDELSSRQVNAASGYQNYRLLGRSKLMIDVGRLVMVAPQFLTSEAKVIGQALKPYGAEQRRMLLIQGLTIYVGARILNQLLDGDPHLEAANMFSVVYHGRAYGMRAIVPDLAHALSRDGFWAGRLGPLPKAGIEAFTGRDMRTGARINSYIQWAPGRMAEIFAGNLVKWLVPGGAEGFLPGAAGREQNSLSTLLMSTAGVTSHKYTAQTQVSGWAADFNRNSGDPSARTHQRQLDTEAHVESAYRKLDALLDENKIDQADAEYSELVKDGHKPGNIAERYSHVMRPFTGQGAREGAFRDSLSAGQREIYQRALDERRARLGAFQRMIAKDAETRRHGDTERN